MPTSHLFNYDYGFNDFPRLRKERMEKLIRFLKSMNLDAVYLTLIENVRYAADLRPVVSVWFRESYAALVHASGRIILLTSPGDLPRFRAWMKWVNEVKPYPFIRRAKFIADLLREERLSAARVGYDFLSHGLATQLLKILPSLQLMDIGGRWSEERAVKTPAEIEAIEEAAAITELAVQAALDKLKPGVTELEVAAAAEATARMIGAEGVSWSFAAFAGPHISLFLRRSTLRRVRAGELMVMGFATIFYGYNTDVTVTAPCGQPSAEQKDVYRATYEAYLEAFKLARPGVETRRLHEKALEVIKEAGYGRYSYASLHPLLHGVGLNVYEPPWSPEPGGEEPSTVLREGHTLALEPAVALFDRPDIGGCRIGQTILITGAGAKELTKILPDSHDEMIG